VYQITCVIYVTEPDLQFFGTFWRVSFSKCSMKMLAIIGEMEDPIAASEVCS